MRSPEDRGANKVLGAATSSLVIVRSALWVGTPFGLSAQQETFRMSHIRGGYQA